jgi:hypothetical protein
MKLQLIFALVAVKNGSSGTVKSSTAAGLARGSHNLISQADAALTWLALMLILDVKTRWSSTHQMLRKCRSILYDKPTKAFCSRTCT